MSRIIYTLKFHNIIRKMFHFAGKRYKCIVLYVKHAQINRFGGAFCLMTFTIIMLMITPSLWDKQAGYAPFLSVQFCYFCAMVRHYWQKNIFLLGFMCDIFSCEVVALMHGVVQIVKRNIYDGQVNFKSYSLISYIAMMDKYI